MLNSSNSFFPLLPHSCLLYVIKEHGTRVQNRFLFFFALQKFRDKVTSSVYAWCRAHKFFTDVSVLYSFIWLEKGKKKQESLLSCISVHNLFFHPLLWIVGILLISKLLLYHPLFPCATVFVQSFGGLCMFLNYFPFHIIFSIYFPLILYLAQSIHSPAPLLSACLCLAIVTVVVCIWHFQITVYPSF